MRYALIALLLAGCDRGMIDCGNGWACPIGLACDLAHRGCVLPDQLQACQGAADRAACSYAGVPLGTCIDGVCFPATCGNSLLEGNEVCDDGNRINGDGCAADCSVIETCGNASVETGLGEQCDDGDLRNHDGCNSVCQAEQPDWRLALATKLPPRRYAAIAHDAIRQRTVIFGGQEIALAADTWEWDGDAWIRSPSSGPGKRLASAITFDAARGEVVLFGGLINGSSLGADTWVYDGVRWTKRMPAASPPPRNGATLAYDTKRKRAVLFGGYDGGVRGDLWEWDGASWMDKTPMQSPPPRNLPVLCFDPVTATTLMLGGVNAMGLPIVNELWAFDGTSWNQRQASALPSGLAFTMARDPTRGRIALLTNDGVATVHWEWDGTAWTRPPFVLPPLDADGSVLFYDHGRKQLGLVALIESPRELALMYLTPTGWVRAPDPVEPQERNGAGFAYDTERGEAVMFGGLASGGSPLGDLWAWRGTHWHALVPVGPAPSPRSGHAMAYDAQRGEVLVIGGHTATLRTGETWAWNGTTWRLAGSMPPHEQMAAAYDARRDRVVAFGGVSLGFDGFDHHVAETWEWDGQAWTQIAIGPSPPARGEHAMAYDPVRERIVMFGGINDYETLADTWEYDGTTWQPMQPSLVPRTRRGHVLAYDAARGMVVMMGGRSSPLDGDQLLADTWEWNGSDWTPVATFTAPPPRRDHAAAYDPVNARVVAFGGATSNETWTYGYDGGLPSEVCGGGHDADRDGLVGCADPDCWWACSPECPPNATCDPAAPRCGDGACSDHENCRACSTDCGACTPACGDLLCDTGETGCPGDCP